jgi:mRNA interferase HigB
MVLAPKLGAAYPILDVRVIARSTLSVFWREHPDAEQQLRAWFHEAEAADWRTTSQVQADFPKASILKGGRVVFDICGNRYRLVVHCRHPYVFVRFIGTHAEYDRIDAQTI